VEVVVVAEVVVIPTAVTLDVVHQVGIYNDLLTPA
jgi:hypothetical protein